MGSPLDLARAWVDAGTVPGVAAAWSIAGRDRRGVRRRRVARGDEPVGPATRFALASLTKPLIAAGVPLRRRGGAPRARRRSCATASRCATCCRTARGCPPRRRDLDVAPLDPPGTYRRYSNAGYALAGAARRATRPRCRSASTCARPCSTRSAWTPRSASTRRTRSAPPSCASPASGRTASSSSTARRSVRRRSPRAAASRPRRAYARFLTCLLDGGRARGGRLLARRDRRRHALDPVRRAARRGRGASRLWDACPWGLGLDVRGTREPHWTGDALTRDREHPLRQLGHARLDRPRARARPRRAREPRLLLGLVVASAAAGPTSRLRCVASAHCAALSALGLASTTSKSAPVICPSACRSSSSKCGSLAPEMYQGLPLSARIIP